MGFLAALYAALMLILNPAAFHHPKPRPHARLVLPDVPTHEVPEPPKLQPPEPRALPYSQPVDDKRSGADNSSRAVERGTEDNPVIVKIKPPDTQQQKPGEQTGSTESKDSADWWIVRLTALLVVATFLQFFALVGQGFVFLIQARRLRETIDKMDEIATTQRTDTQALLTATRDNAKAAADQATAMGKLHLAAEAQERVMQRQASIAERSLAANRPFVFFHGLHGSQIPHKNEFKIDDPKDWDEVDYVFRLQFSTPYTLVNQGRTVAVVHDVWLALQAMDTLPEPPTAEYRRAVATNISKPKIPIAMIVPNVPVFGGTPAIEPPIDDKAQIRRILEGKDSYYLYGFVRYSDIIAGQTYLTGQAFRYDLKAKGFIVVGGEAYNYDRTLSDPPQPDTDT